MSPSIEELLKSSKLKKPSDDDTATEKLQKKLQAIKGGELEQEIKTRAEKLGYGYANLQKGGVMPEALNLIPKQKAEEARAVCFLTSINEVKLGAVDPADPKVQEISEQIKKDHGLRVNLHLISQDSFDKAMALYSLLPKIKKSKGQVTIEERDLNNLKTKIKTFKDLAGLIKEVPLTDFMALVIAGAIQSRASDIHIEAEENAVKLRYRIDGVLQDIARLPYESWPKIISRIKLFSGLKLNITSKPQDGRFTITLTKDKVDVRVSCLPTAYGESVVMRLLMSSAMGLAFEDLGLRGEAFKRMEQEIKKTNGMILTTGPTGSGKTTTLYAILNNLNQPGTKIITLEDPVEYKLKGINQSQVDKSKDYTFANGLRSILRQDPDIVMVGEIRDLETAEIAINAALTGHLVISTLHTNNAAASVPRLLAMGVKPFLLAPALNAVIGQRLCRRICKKCKVEDKPNPETLEKIKKILKSLPPKDKEGIDMDNLKFYTGKGCSQCDNLGYHGRIGIYEALTRNKEITDMINQGKVNDADLQVTAVENGMITMAQDGLLRVLDGVTSVAEVERTIGL
ncbi:GspE/PulE family protein [Patescibacteria group bacterium]|nr:GspE/PulE family protein [Patescibacteria group bacterium]MBU4512211.1 GspE/PulE family protein [Patescibacteria group bacterium]MCG2692629.1 GspE/PulE family protein [Candidatus Parcubacteria bacterium]